jgi:hypothetical protein
MFKLNLLAVYYDAKCLYVERIFPEGKPICCCLCDVTIGTISNFRKHMKSKHAEIKLIESPNAVYVTKNSTKVVTRASTSNAPTT